MESFARPLRSLQEEMSWFVRAEEIKALHVTTEATLRRPALDLIAAHEYHADNRALFVPFEDPFSGADHGWSVRTQRLREQLAEKTAAVAPAGIELRPLAEDRIARDTNAASDFATTLMNVRSVLAPPITGLVVVMAPVRVDMPVELGEEIRALLLSPQLSHVRFVLVEVDGPWLGPVLEPLGERVLTSSCLVDHDAGKQDLATAGAATAASLGGFTLPAIAAAYAKRTWRAPGAAPDVAAPPRIEGERVPPPTGELDAVGISQPLVEGGGEALKQLILGAALAMREGRKREAIELQTRAATLCGEMKMLREHIINLMVLGGYLLGTEARERARDTYAYAAQLARTHQLPDAESQAELALGMLNAADQRAPQAAAHYSAAAKLAETAHIIPLAMECWRMAGQLALESGLESSAVDCWKRAIALAGTLEPELAQLTSAAETARALASLCRKRGLVPQASALERQSIELEQRPEPPPGARDAPPATAAS